MKTERVDLPKIIGALPKNQNCVLIVEALEYNGSDLVALRCYEVSEDKMHLLKDEVIMQRHQAVNIANMLLEAADLLGKLSTPSKTTRRRKQVQEKGPTKKKPRRVPEAEVVNASEGAINAG